MQKEKQTQGFKRNQLHEQGFKRKRHAEKIVLKNGNVVVKIIKVSDELKSNDMQSEVVCVHVFSNNSLSTVKETYYSHNALNRWSQACAEMHTLPEDLNNAEFRNFQNTIARANLAVFHLKRKAQLHSRKLNKAS